MKKNLGLDIGTNSIGWAVVQHDAQQQTGEILGMGSRIIPMDGRDKKFDVGESVSKAAERRQFRSARRLLQRYKLRRERLIAVLKILGWVPEDFPVRFNTLSTFNINQYLPFSEATLTEVCNYFSCENPPVDWIVYYLRDKALRQPITLPELARVLYLFNQRRGFLSSRKIADEATVATDEQTTKKRIKKTELVEVLELLPETERSKNKTKYLLRAQTQSFGIITATIERNQPPEWTGKELELEITVIPNKQGEKRFELKVPEKTEWTERKTALEADLVKSGLTPGAYFLQHIAADRNYKVRGRVLGRAFYEEELRLIWEKQSEFHPELQSNQYQEAIAGLLYQHNQQKQSMLKKRSLHEIITKDIIYYSRGLKSQKHLIAGCRFEKKNATLTEGKQAVIRVAPVSSPVFQEFRIWQFIHSLKILERMAELPGGIIKMDIDRTAELLTHENKAKLFTFLNNKGTITNNEDNVIPLLKELGLNPKKYRSNFPPKKKIVGNETRAAFLKVFKEYGVNEALLDDPAVLEKLWHMVYSINEDKDLAKALQKHFRFSDSADIQKKVVEGIVAIPAYKKEYASLSAKAINKLLPLMRCGRYWSAEGIDLATRGRITALLNGNNPENIAAQLVAAVNKKVLKRIEDFQGLEMYLACYLVYNKHAEPESTEKLERPEQLRPLQRGELRNPVVESIVNETILLVRDIWKKYGRPDEIHIELGREIANNAEDRKKISDAVSENEKERERIKLLLRELALGNPNSPGDIEKLRLLEDTVALEHRGTRPKLSKEPTSSEIQQYRLWIEAKCCSPYTGQPITLARLFTADYQVEHIIPRSRFFDDSFANKTICESAVNSFKDSMTAMEFIQKYGGTTQQHNGVTFTLQTVDAYIQHVQKTFTSRQKVANLLRVEVPKDFIKRKLNETRYINRKLGEILAPVAASEGSPVVFTIGQITTDLKDAWGLNRVWKEILKPRFERFQQMSGVQLVDFDSNTNNVHFRREYKRIDHRHHAMDALVIALTSRSHILFLNTLESQEGKREFVHLEYTRKRKFALPWPQFTRQARECLQQVIVSHKCAKKLISKPVNRYTKWMQDEDGIWRKRLADQQPPKQEGKNWSAVRVSLFKEPYGKVTIAEGKTVTLADAIKRQLAFILSGYDRMHDKIQDKLLRATISEIIKNCEFNLEQTLEYIKTNPLFTETGERITKVTVLTFKEYAAKRVKLDASFDLKKIEKIPYARHQKLARILKEHLENFDNDTAEAFAPEGLEQLTKAWGRPLTKIRLYENIGSKIRLNDKFVETDKGALLYFAVYQNRQTGKTEECFTIPLIEALQRLLAGKPLAEEREHCKLTILSPGDLIYVPRNESEPPILPNTDNRSIAERIYKVVSFTDDDLFCTPHHAAIPLEAEKIKELGSNNKAQRVWDYQTGWETGMIKDYFVMIKINRLGVIER